MDEGGLKWLLELNAKVDGGMKLLDVTGKVDSKLHGLDDTLKKIEHGSKKASDSHAKHAHSLNGLGGVMEHVKHKGHELLEALGLVFAFEMAEKFIETVKELGGEILHAAAAAERTGVSFKLMLGAEEGSEVVEYIEKISKYTEFTDDQLKGMAQSLAAAGFKAKEIPRALAAGLDIAAFSKDGVGGLERGVEALSRLKSTGMINARTILGLNLGEKGLHGFYEEMSKRTGTGIATLKKQMESGKVDIQAAQESLYSMLVKRTGTGALGGAGVAMGETMGAHLTHLRDLPEQYFQALSKSQGFETLKGVFGGLLEQLDPESGTGRAIGASFEQMFGAIANALKGVDIKAFGEAVLDFFQKLPERAGVVIDILSGFGTVLGWVATAFDAFGTVLGEMAGEIYLFFEGLTEIGTAIGDFFGGLFVTIYDYGGRFFEGAKALGIAVWQGIRDGVMAGVTAVTDAVSGLGKAMVGKLKGLLGISSPSKVFENFGLMSGMGFVRGIEASSGQVDDAVERSFGPLIPSSREGASGSASASMGGPITVNVPITINVPGGAGTDPDMIAARVRDILPGSLQTAFEQLRNQVGA